MQKIARKIISNEVFMARLGRGVHIFATMGWFWPWQGKALVGKKKKVARNWLKFCMIVYDTILSIHAKNCSENSFKRSFYGTAWSRCAHFCHHGLIFGLGGQKKKKFSELSQILHGSLWPHCKHSRKKSWPNSLKWRFYRLGWPLKHKVCSLPSLLKVL